MANNKSVVEVSCLGCSRPLRMPRGAWESKVNNGRAVIAYCSNRCQRNYISKIGNKEKQRAIDDQQRP